MVLLAVEDVVSEAVCKTALESLGVPTFATVGMRGKDYLQSRIANLNRSAHLGLPVVMLVDLDSPALCAPRLSSEWLPEGNRNEHFLLRVAVMEVESWVMADRRSFADFFAIPVGRLPLDTDSVPNPKEKLVALCRHSKKRQIRADVVPASRSTARVGAAYNPTLVEFVRTRWNASSAAMTSESFRRTYDRLEGLASRV